MIYAPQQFTLTKELTDSSHLGMSSLDYLIDNILNIWGVIRLIRLKTNRRQQLPLNDVIFAVTYKTYSMLSARRFASDMRDALAKGYVSKVPSFNSVFDYLQMETLTVSETVDLREQLAASISRDRRRG